jgi:uncharacterized protein YlxW (UPF0749 family)
MDQPQPAGGRRLVGRLWSDVLAPRGWRTDVPVAVLALLLGLGFAITLRTERASNGLAAARPADLVAILADLSTRNEQLQRGIAQLQEQAHELESGDPGVALQTAREREQQLAILAGTVGAQGPGVVVTITDPQGSVQPDVLVDAIEELRDAGAEAIDLSGVRIVTQSYVVAGDAGGLDVDGTAVRTPYVLTAIGDPQTLAEALAIPGGVVDAVAGSGGAHAAVEQRSEVRITSLRVATTDRYARPDPEASGS